MKYKETKQIKYITKMKKKVHELNKKNNTRKLFGL